MNSTIIKLKAYSDYKPSGLEWLGDIPEHWEVLPGLSFIFENKDRNKGMKRNTVLSLSYGKIRVKKESELTGLVPESFETYQFVNKGDLIFRPTDLQNDTVSLRSSISEYEGIITNAYINLRFKPKANSKFYHYFFRSIDNNKIIYGLGSGLRQNISYLDFRRFQFPFPPIQEQTAIAEFLDDKTAKIDQAIVIKQQQIDLLKERKQILIHKAVTQGINTNVKLKNSGVEWIGEIPEGWEVKRLKFNLKNSFSGGTPSTDKLIYWDGGIPWVSSVDVKVDYLEKTVREISVMGLQNSSSNIAPKGALIFVTRSGILQHTFAISILNKEMAINQDIKCIIFNDQIQSEYFLNLIKGNNSEILVEVRQQAATVESINMSSFYNLPIPIPPIQVQKEISVYIENATHKIATAISLKEQEIEKLKEYKSSLIDGVVTGKVRVC